MQSNIYALILGVFFQIFFIDIATAQLQSPMAIQHLWLEIAAKTVQERTALASQGYDIVAVEEDRVIVLGTEGQLLEMQRTQRLLATYPQGLSPFDFPKQDADFHNYQELTEEIKKLALKNPSIMTVTSIGSTIEKRDLWLIRLSTDTTSKPATVFMGGHHAREHVSVEVPLRLVQYLLEEYNKKNPRIVSLFNNYEIFVIPLVNPDGAEFDISTGNYQYWRKNREFESENNYGVDLNRNYGYGWGGVGASTNPSSETYRGPSAFSEQETQAIKNWVEQTPQLQMMLSYHTFSKLVLWPWGHIEGKISNSADLLKFETMGKTMAKMAGYRPMKSGDLYLASGDTCDWAYGEHGIFAFTFELDPQSQWEGGFYPGASVIEGIFQKNIEPALYLVESAVL
jgi:carboxypeptidase T